MTLHQLACLARELSAELFHRNVYRWRGPLHAAEDLDDLAVEHARSRIARSLAATVIAET